jgi:NAD(P)H-flavin reductase
MAKLHRISLGNETFHANSGQLLLDAALVSGVDLPHDCRAGRCGSCLTRVCQGITLGGEARQAGLVHACQARVFSDLALEIEALPPVERIKGKIVRLIELAEDIVEVTMALDRKFDMLPGQYCRFSFRGFPARPFSPTASLSAIESDGRLRLNIKRVRDGRVTPQLGKTIGQHHSVAIEGPFGHAFFRSGLDSRLILVGSGTGFAPVWAVAAAALRENPQRSIVLIAVSRKAAGFYMAPALELANEFANVSVVAAIEELKSNHGLVMGGPAIGHLPRLSASDIIYAAGGPSLVDAVGEAAEAAGALFYSDPFEPMAPPTPSWLDLAKDWLKTG